MQFASPLLLGGLTLAVLPVLIHLWLRPRPLRVAFPALTFLHRALACGQRAHRLRNVWLLCARSLLLACTALLLAGPTCAPPDDAGLSGGPLAAVMVVDDSLSMHYRLADGQTALATAIRQASRLPRAASALPARSALGLVWADPQRPGVPLTEELAVLRTALGSESTTRAHPATLAAAVRRAGQWLQGARQPDRRLVVFSDLAAHAWRDVPPGVLAGIEHLSVQIVPSDAEPRTNLAITDVRVPGRVRADSTPIPIEATISAAGVDSVCTLDVLDGDERLVRVGPLELDADRPRQVALRLPPRAAGPHALTLRLEPSDRLDFDQRRYIAFQTGPRPLVWLVTPDDAADSDLTALLLQNLLAPAALEREKHPVVLRSMTPPQLAQSALDLSGGIPGREENPTLLLILPCASLSEAARRELVRRIEQGAAALLLPGSTGGGTDWPGLRQYLSAAPPTAQTLEAVTTLAWEASSPFAGPREGLDELPRCGVRRRLKFESFREGVVVQARYADGSPAILSQRVGKGSLFLLTTSPDPAWSELGVRAAGLLTWLDALLAEAAGPADAVAEFTAGQSTARPFAALPPDATVHLLSPHTLPPTSLTLRLSGRAPQRDWPTDQAGIFTLRPERADSPPVKYVVNWPPEESDFGRITAERLRSLLGVEAVTVGEQSFEPRESVAASLVQRLGLQDPARLLPLLLLGLLVGELLLASRTSGAHPRASQ